MTHIFVVALLAKVEYSRSDYHPYLGILTLIFLLAGIAVGVFAAKSAGGLAAVYTTNGITAYIVFIFSASNAAQHELAKPYIFLVPASSLLKIIGSNLIDILRMSAKQVLPGFTICSGASNLKPFYVTIYDIIAFRNMF